MASTVARTATGEQGLTVTINDRALRAESNETILQAALRSGVEFPHGCGVGGCGTCKCRVRQGEVKELTESGYLLTSEEIAQGYVLACQTVARTDVRVEVDLGAQSARRKVAGRVVEQIALTHDTSRLVVALDEPLSYRAGQYADLEIEGYEGVVRSYSFAARPRGDGRVSFVVRRVPGGRLSTAINEEDVIGRSVQVDGPRGDFWIRPGDTPLVLVAGGSGLAPILAMLEEALAAGCSRSVTLLFGARDENDLYALEQIDAIARGWRGGFQFVPVLSAPAGSSWRGERGLVTGALARFVEPGVRVYLCGPPAMIDAALACLEGEGVSRDRIYFDRFATKADAAAPRARQELAARPDEGPAVRDAGVLDYLKYFLFHAVGLLSLNALVIGRHLSIGLFAVLVIYFVGDALLGDDSAAPRFKRPGILTVQLWLALPLLTAIVFVSVWGECSGDPLGFGAWVTRCTGYDVFAGRVAAWPIDHLSRWLLTGLMIGMIGTIPAHELTHRTWDPRSMLIGRWLLAFSFDTAFSLEHVYGHHRYVSTEQDPATAPRGRNVYAHIVISFIRGNVSAWRIEAERLAKRHLPTASLHNVFLRGQLMSAALLAAAYAMGGWRAMAFFVACGLWGKALLEIVNYMEHYGMVRDPAVPVQPRHSWNTNRRVSSWTMFNLTRHSHHHAQGEVPYQDLQPYKNAPEMVNGYLATIILTLIPPLWHALMTPKVIAWDRDFASDDERVLAARANARSGIAALRAAPVTAAQAPAAGAHR